MRSSLPWRPTSVRTWRIGTARCTKGSGASPEVRQVAPRLGLSALALIRSGERGFALRRVCARRVLRSKEERAMAERRHPQVVNLDEVEGKAVSEGTKFGA